MENILDSRQRITFALDPFVKLTEIIDGADGAIFLGDDHHWHAPFAFADAFEDLQLALTVEFVFEDVHVLRGDGIGALNMVRNSVGLEFDVKLALFG